MNAFENMLRAREARARSPAFQAEMAREKTEFMDVLSKLGDNSFEAGSTVLLKTPYRLLMNGLRTAYDSKYTMKDYGKDTSKLFFGKDGVAHNVTKVTTNLLHLGMKGTKIGLRKLFAK